MSIAVTGIHTEPCQSNAMIAQKHSADFEFPGKGRGFHNRVRFLPVKLLACKRFGVKDAIMS